MRKHHSVQLGYFGAFPGIVAEQGRIWGARNWAPVPGSISNGATLSNRREHWQYVVCCVIILREVLLNQVPERVRQGE